MKYFAIIKSDNSVENVITAPDDSTADFYANLFGKRCLETFADGSQRTRYAGAGMLYLEEYDAFVHPQPYASWTLNTKTLEYESPSVKPEDDDDYFYTWDEENVVWKKNSYPHLSFTQEDKDLINKLSSPEEIDTIKDQLSETARNHFWPT